MKNFYQTLTTRNERGFTLIELLVVIAIIAVLAALVLAALSSAQKGARDSRRRSDLNQYKTALVQYSADGNTLPVASDQTTGAQPLGTALGTNYLNPSPKPPTQGSATQTTYKYFPGANAGEFVLCVELERNAGKWVWTTSTAQTDTNAAVCAAGNAG